MENPAARFPAWPGDAQVAVALTFDVDGEAPWLSEGPEYARRLTMLSQGRFGPGQEAVPLAEEAGAAGAPCAAASEAGSAERRVLLREIDVHLRALVEGPHAARDRRIFWLYYRVGLPAASIAALPGIGLSTKGVESTLHRLTRELRERLAAGKPGAPEPLAGEGIRPSESF